MPQTRKRTHRPIVDFPVRCATCHIVTSRADAMKGLTGWGHFGTLKTVEYWFCRDDKYEALINKTEGYDGDRDPRRI